MDDEQRRIAQAREKMAPLQFLTGRFTGTGNSHGTPLTGTLVAEWILSGTALQVRERLHTVDGILDHEDLSIYWYKAADQLLWVQQLTAPGVWSSRPVLVLSNGGVRWYDGPDGPQVILRPEPEDVVSIEVFFPGGHEAAITMRYHRAP
ncbi:MAG: hypothetical protein AAFV53_13810 [Myxococcota bacterium]